MQKRINIFFKRFPVLSYTVPLLLFIGIEGLFSFCSRSCPPFSDAAFDSWFPHKQGQQLYFTSSLNRRDTLRIGTVEKSENYTTTTGLHGRPCAMTASITSIDTLNRNYKFSISYNKSNVESSLRLHLYDCYIAHLKLSDTSITAEPSYFNQFVSSRFFSTAVINGKVFNNVVAMQKDTTTIKSEGVYKMWVSKNNGLVGYERYPSFEQFSKQ